MERGSAGRTSAAARVVELAAVRQVRKRAQLLADLARAQDGNRRAVARLLHTNLLFTRRGARAGRQLLANWERLVEEADRLKRLEAVAPDDADPTFALVEALLVKSERLASRSAELVAQSK